MRKSENNRFGKENFKLHGRLNRTEKPSRCRRSDMYRGNRRMRLHTKDRMRRAVIFFVAAGVIRTAGRGLRQANSGAQSTKQQEQADEHWNNAPHTPTLARAASCFAAQRTPSSRRTARVLLRAGSAALALQRSGSKVFFCFATSRTMG